MLFIQNDNTNPYFNLALEEYLLKEFEEDCFMLWQNEPCVVIGRNQNPLIEINREFVENNNIKVTKRLSGGGAVYHDLGNLNFTFIINDTENNLRNYKKFLTPIIEFLATLGIKAEMSERNDLTINGLKFSGNAQYKYKNRLMHHGTILFESSLDDVISALKIKYNENERWVKSVPSPITNIKPYLTKPLSIENLKALICEYIDLAYQKYDIYRLNQNDLNVINNLVNTKYKTKKWNYANCCNLLK